MMPKIAANVWERELGVDICLGCHGGRETGPCRKCHGQTVVLTGKRIKKSGVRVFGAPLEQWPMGSYGAIVERFLGSDADFIYDIRRDAPDRWTATATTWDYDGETGGSFVVTSDSRNNAARALESGMHKIAIAVSERWGPE